MNNGEGLPNTIPSTPLKEPKQWSGKELADAAEDAVADFLKGYISPIDEVRISNHEEDSGRNQIERGNKIDLIVYIEKKPALVVQVTISSNEKILEEKKRDVKDRPFVRLKEMTRNDHAVPKVLVTLSGSSVKVFEENNRKFNDHREILMKVLKQIREGLSELQSQNPEEIERIKKLIEIFSMEKASPTHLGKTS